MRKFHFRSLILIAAAISSVAFAGQADWSKFTSKEGSLSASAPSSWILGDTENEQFKAAYQKIKENNPKLAESMSSNLSDKYILTLFDLQGAGEGAVVADCLNIVKQPHGGLTVKMYGDVAKELQKGLPLKGKLENKVIDTANGKTLTYWGTIDVKGPDNVTRSLDLLGVMFLKSENVYIATFVTSGKLKEKRETWDKIVKSFKLG